MTRKTASEIGEAATLGTSKKQRETSIEQERGMAISGRIFSEEKRALCSSMSACSVRPLAA
jgi:hypothetical protein